ncbi:uncharacterized protein si:ch211-51h4.2 isoform X2 [Callorhinchus milii]|uniref:uncharacterized protein si:ch211-51h4.2 isoform X2 n=1 Tax=Callorhinchus milii TaxID=7868 RepID=UPI001C3FCAB2|nr:uncharacterized protein si:ch211-51h4.2 isoform X2 [Callorhinchus milii]
MLQCYFISIGSILGTGILGLPVTIAHAGLQPFLVSFVIGFFMQVLLIYLFVDLLQRCRVAQADSVKAERILMQDVSDQDNIPSPVEEDEETEDAGHVLLHQAIEADHCEEEQVPNLHILGVLFLHKYMSYAFSLHLMLHFISIGISYVLAGSEAFAELLQIRYLHVIPFFTWILVLGIITAQVVLQPIMSILTLVKGSFLILTVIVTFVVGSEVHQEISNDFSSIGTPFLMGTVALGGVVNVMPMLFSEISQNRCQVLWFRRAIIGGLTTCAILNIFCSEMAGEIATLPLTKIIMEQYSRFAWVAWLTEIFIAVSITVSFLVLGSTMKHTLEGWVDSFWSRRCDSASEYCPRLHKMWSLKSMTKMCVSLLAFTVIFTVAVSDSKGFVVVLDKVASFALNLEAGLFIFLMLRNCQSEPYKHIIVPLTTSPRVFSLHWLLPIYFLFAVGYDIEESLVLMAQSWTHTHLISANATANP